ncbi:MAG: YitT family protein [Bacilli bacterium]|nr:YitT family protein [Bacilli bacterium]
MKYKDYLYLLILLFLASINFNLFVKPNNLVCGGSIGLAIIINKLTSIEHSVIILIINIIMFLLSIIFLNKKITLGSLIATIVYPVFVKITSNFVISSNIVLSIIIVGIFSGITNGLIYKLGFTTGGINLIGPIFSKYFNIKIGTINLFINLIIMLLNLIIFGINNLIYSVIIIILNSIVINLILYKKTI